MAMLRAVGLFARRGAQASTSLAATNPAASPLLRQYATEASGLPAGVLIGVPGKYALALHNAASKANAADKVEKELKEVMGMSETSAEFGLFMQDPTIAAKPKEEALKAMLAKAGMTDITQNFLSVVVENRRVGLLSKIVEQYVDVMSHLRGEVKATVTTAEPLSASELVDVRNNLMQQIGKDKKLFIEQKVDPAIIGGMVMDIGDKHIDMSILSRVKKVQQMILEAQL